MELLIQLRFKNAEALLLRFFVSIHIGIILGEDGLEIELAWKAGRILFGENSIFSL